MVEEVQATEVNGARDQALVPKETTLDHIPVSSQLAGRTSNTIT